MTYPIPGVGIGTPYGKRGSHWSCNENSAGDGVHTGVDFPAAAGTNIYAPIAGQIRHRSYGSAFGSHQFAISPDPGQPFAAGEVFFAHTTNRPKDGVFVEVGDYVADVGAEGNVTGPHLHLEYHADTKGSWSCSVHDDPKPILDHDPDQTGGELVWSDYSGKAPGELRVTNGQDYEPIDVRTADPPSSGLELHLLYVNATLEWSGAALAGVIRVKYCRDNGDDTAYQDYAIPAGVALGTPDTFLITATHWEAGEKGLGGRWHIRCAGDLAAITLGTRYAKIAVIS